MTLEGFFQSISNVAHGVFRGYLIQIIVWSAVLYAAYRFARWLIEENTERQFIRFFYLLVTLAIMEFGVRENSTTHLYLGFALFLGVGQVVYSDLIEQYRPHREVSFSDLKPVFILVCALGATVIASFVSSGNQTSSASVADADRIKISPELQSKAPEVKSTPKTTPQEPPPPDYRLAPNTVLVVERVGLSVRESACSDSEPATYTDGEKIILSQTDEVKITDEPIAYCTKGIKSYPWALVSFQVASGVRINDGRGGQGWVSLCDTRPQDESVAKHPVCKR